LFGIVFLVENNFTTKGTPPTQISYTRNHHNSTLSRPFSSRLLPASATENKTNKHANTVINEETQRVCIMELSY
jgi:hypothetical protein